MQPCMYVKNPACLKFQKQTQKAVRLNRKLLLGYASSLMRLFIFTEQCGTEHSCTKNEVRIQKRYDSAIATEHMKLNVGSDWPTVVRAIHRNLMAMAPSVVESFELEPEFQEEILEQFKQFVDTRFSSSSHP